MSYYTTGRLKDAINVILHYWELKDAINGILHYWETEGCNKWAITLLGD